MRKLKYYLACSLDGFIAREDGSSDYFVMKGDHADDYSESFKLFDVILMGRKTYDGALKAGITNPYPGLKTYVFSRTMKDSPDNQVEIVKDAVELIKKLKNETGKDIWLCGGGELAATLFDEDLIDEVMLDVNPVLIGSGIPLLSAISKQIELECNNSRLYEDGVLRIRYRVRN